MLALTKRNTRIYFRDPVGVFFSMLGAVMVLAVYLLFLGDNLARGFSALPDGKLFATTWMLAGMCSVAPLTASFGVAGQLVLDRTRGLEKDFLASPIRRYKVAGGYLASAVLVALLIPGVILAVSLVWLGAMGAAAPTALLLAQLYGVLALSGLAASCISFFLAALLHKYGAYNATATVVGTLSGFLAGIYLPVGELPAAVQTVVRLFPPSHAASLLRSLMLEGIAAKSYAGVPTAAMDEIFELLGVRFSFGGEAFPLWGSLLVLAGTALGFFLLATAALGRKKK